MLQRAERRKDLGYPSNKTIQKKIHDEKLVLLEELLKEKERIDEQERNDSAREELLLGKKSSGDFMKDFENFSSSDDEPESATRAKRHRDKEEAVDQKFSDLETQLTELLKNKA